MSEIRMRNIAEVRDIIERIKATILQMNSVADSVQNGITALGHSTQSRAFDKVKESTDALAEQLDSVSRSFNAVEDFTNELISYVERYSQYGYNGNRDRMANVTLDEVRDYRVHCDEVEQALNRFMRTFDEDYNRIKRELCGYIQDLAEKIRDCTSAVSTLNDKIQRSRATVERLQSSLNTENERMAAVEHEIDKYVKAAEEAQEEANNIFIPPYEEKVIRHSDGSVEKRNNLAERHAAIEEQNQYRSQAIEARGCAAAKNRERESIENNIKNLSRNINTISTKISDMEELKAELIEHISKMTDTRNEMQASSDELTQIFTYCGNYVDRFRRILEPAIKNLECAYNALQCYCGVNLRISRRWFG